MKREIVPSVLSSSDLSGVYKALSVIGPVDAS